MTTFRLIVAVLVMLIAASVVMMNWICIIMNMHDKRKGINKHYSTVPVASLILAYSAAHAYPHEPKVWIGIIPLVDIGNWFMLWLPVVLIKETIKRRRE